MPIGFTYILLCEDDHLYTGSTIDIQKRFQEHKNSEGANFTKSHPPIRIVYLEKFNRIDQAFEREKQIQKWRRDKKIALIKGNYNLLKELSILYRDLKLESCNCCLREVEGSAHSLSNTFGTLM